MVATGACSTITRLGLKAHMGSTVMIGKSCASTDPKSMVVYESARSEEGDAVVQSSEAGLPLLVAFVWGSGEDPGKKTEGENPSLIVGSSTGARHAFKLGASATGRSESGPTAKSDGVVVVLSMLSMVDQEQAMGLGGRSLSPASGGKLSGMFTSVALRATSSSVENMEHPFALH